MGSPEPERGPGEDREGDAVFRAGMRVEHHGNQHNQVAEENGQDGLPPVHPAGNQAGGQHVGRDANRHADPEGGDIPQVPLAVGDPDRSHVPADKRAGQFSFPLVNAVDNAFHGALLCSSQPGSVKQVQPCPASASNPGTMAYRLHPGQIQLETRRPRRVIQPAVTKPQISYFFSRESGYSSAWSRMATDSSICSGVMISGGARKM